MTERDAHAGGSKTAREIESAGNLGRECHGGDVGPVPFDDVQDVARGEVATADQAQPNQARVTRSQRERALAGVGELQRPAAGGR